MTDHFKATFTQADVEAELRADDGKLLQEAVDKLNDYEKRIDLITINHDEERIAPAKLRAIAALAEHFNGAYLLNNGRGSIIVRDKTQAELEETIISREYSNRYWKAEKAWRDAKEKAATEAMESNAS